MGLLFILGFASGLPLYLTSQTLQAWLTDAGIPNSRIAALSLVGLAYTLKFLWAPLLDRFALPYLGRRRGWIITFQVGLVVAIGLMSLLDPVADPELLVAVAIAVAFLSASQDVVLDAYNADVLAPEERAAGAAVYVLGYRTAMVVTGTLALLLTAHVSWSAIYVTMAALMAACIAGTLLAEEPPVPQGRPRSLVESLYLPFLELWRRLGPRRVALVLAFTALYKAGDYFAQALVITFLVRGAQFELQEIGAIYQALGFVGTALGGLAAGSLVAKLGLRRMLIVFGLLQASTNLLYALLAVTGKSFPVFCTAVLVDNLANAMGTAAFVAFLMSVCSPAVSATQFALLTSLSSVGQRLFGPLAANVVDAVDWSGFFLVTAALAIPGLVLAAVVARPDSAGPRSSAEGAAKVDVRSEPR
ncbi:MAG: MFS transporter [Deltaproteobacteria bacterium]|nr:MFS transporter [Deltaproteobacteria bacterium]